jgi:hypothetical protein
MKFEECTGCGNEPKFVLLNGYSFGDRLLEDVMFKVVIENNKFKCLGVTEDSQSYFNDLNTKKWMKECEEYASDNDAFTCSTCKEDIFLLEE